jgi:opacity protein-like surface antigen
MGIQTIHRVKKTLAVLLLVLFVVLLTFTTASAKVSPTPDCYQSGNDSGYQKGYSDGFDIGYQCLIPSIHYPTPPYNQFCTGSNKNAFNNGFRAGYGVGYNTGHNAGAQFCLQ